MDASGRQLLLFSLALALLIPACRDVGPFGAGSQHGYQAGHLPPGVPPIWPQVDIVSGTGVESEAEEQDETPAERKAADRTETEPVVQTGSIPEPAAEEPTQTAAAPEQEPAEVLAGAAADHAGDADNLTDPRDDEPPPGLTALPPTAIPVVESEPVSEAQPSDDPAPAVQAPDFVLLGDTVPRGTRKQLTWQASETFSGTVIPTPVLVVNGVTGGPVLCLTAAVHGDELNGIETVRRVLHELEPDKLSGAVIGVPIVNLQAFQRHSRYLPDRRDLNRFFPGHPRGSSASRIAHSFFNSVIRHCDYLVDLHTGSFHRTNLPQLRADLNDEGVVRLTQGFGSTVILHSDGGVGTLRAAAVAAGIPAVTLEAGEPLRLQRDAVDHSVKGVETLLDTLGMYGKRSLWGNPEPVYYTSEWVRADQGGILLGKVKLGRRVKEDELLGTVTDPISNETAEIRSPFPGRIIGMAVDQFVMPGFATFHIGKEAQVNEAVLDTEPVVLTHDVGGYDPETELIE